MKDIRRALFTLILLVILIFNIERLDFEGVSIINFRPYFYFLVILSLLTMLGWPLFQKASVYIVCILWGAIYISLWLFFSRHRDLTVNLQITVLEFIFLEATVWLAYDLIEKMMRAENALNALTLDVFPSRAISIEDAAVWVKNEMSRVRRHSRSLSVLMLDPKSLNLKADSEWLLRLQQDILKQFALARVGQIIGEQIRQTDILIKGRDDKFIILMPDTNRDNLLPMVRRILNEIQTRTGISAYFGMASFPRDALTFEELLHKAASHLSPPETSASEAIETVTLSSSAEPLDEKCTEEV